MNTEFHSPHTPTNPIGPIQTAFTRSLGTESALNVVGDVARLQAEGKSVISLCAGQPDFPTPNHIQEAAIKAIRDGAHGYTPPPGIALLREAAAEYLTSLHSCPAVRSDNILIQPGGKPTMFQAIVIFGETGREVVYPDPGFPIYRSMISATGATPIPYHIRSENNHEITAEDILSRLTDRTSLLILNNPGNPCGNVISPQTLDDLVQGLVDRFPNVAVLSDEIYCQILYDDTAYKSLLQYPEIRDRLILLDGWSKSFAMTGWRLGMAVWPTRWIEDPTRISINYHSCPNAPTQYAGLAALKGPQDSIRIMTEAFDQRRHYLHQALNNLPNCSATLPKGAFYMMLDVSKTGMSGEELQQGLLYQAGVATVAGRSFGDVSVNQVRLSFAASMEDLQEAVKRIERFLNGNNE